MSGTSYGAVVLHVAPESAVGGPLALVADRRPDPARRRAAFARLLIDDAELDAAGRPGRRPAKDERGYRQLYEQHVLQANEGCDLDFLRGRSPVIADAVTYL